MFLKRTPFLQAIKSSTSTIHSKHFPAFHQLYSTTTTTRTTDTTDNATPLEDPSDHPEPTTPTASPLDDAIQVIDPNLFPEGVPSHLTQELRHLANPEVSSWVIRNLTKEIQHRLDTHVDPDNDTQVLNDGVVVLAGPREHGKSVVLCQVVQWARSNDWIVLYSPDSGNLLRKGDMIFPSRHNQGSFDQPDLAGPLLQHLRTAHGKQLNRLKIKGEVRPFYTVERERKLKVRAKKKGKTYKSGSGAVDCTLLDICDHGLLNGADAATCYRDLRQQLSLVEKEDGAKILFVIDDVNTLYSDTVFGFEMKKVTADELTLSGALQPFNAKDGLRPDFVPKHGALLCATTGGSDFLPSAKRVQQEAPALYDYLVPVHPYDEDEFDAAIRMYSHNGLVSKNVLRKDRGENINSDIATAKVVSSSHPGVLYEHIVENSIGGVQ